MARLGDLVLKVRSKNAGPFWVTIDIFCGDLTTYGMVVRGISSDDVGRLFGQPSQTIRRFEIPDLHVLKFSLPRPVVQGDRFDRDMHGAQWSVLLAECEINTAETGRC